MDINVCINNDFSGRKGVNHRTGDILQPGSGHPAVGNPMHQGFPISIETQSDLFNKKQASLLGIDSPKQIILFLECTDTGQLVPGKECVCVCKYHSESVQSAWRPPFPRCHLHFVVLLHGTSL